MNNPNDTEARMCSHCGDLYYPDDWGGFHCKEEAIEALRDIASQTGNFDLEELAGYFEG